MVNKQQPPETTPPEAPRGLADMLGITAFMRMFRRRTVLVTAVALAAAVLTAGFLMLRAPSYEATALLLINPPAAGGGGAQPNGPQAEAAISSEIELLRSPALMNSLAQALGVQDGAGEGSPPSDEVISGLVSAISVARRANTFVVEITARSANAERAQLIANTYADIYIASQLNGLAGVDQVENSWVARRLAELRQDAQEKESAAAALRVETGAGLEAPPTMRVTDLQDELQQAQGEASAAEARQRRFQELRASRAAFEAYASAFNTESMRSLRERDAQIARRQADLEARYLPSHPAVQAVRAEREDVDGQIQREIQRLGANIAAEASRARARVQELQGSMRTAVREVADEGADERLRQLEQEAIDSRAVYEGFLERYRASTDQMSGAMARLLSYAVTPAAPASPNLRMALLLALLIGLSLGVGAGAMAELLDRSVKNADDVENKVGHPSIASVPTISKRMMRQMPPAERHPSGYLIGRPMSAFAEALRVLRTVIVYSKFDRPVNVVAITSALPNEGKTTISVCLARVAAMSGQRVIVVDCDLRKQSINDVIDIETDVGILQVLAGEAPWRSAIVRDPNSEAHVLPVASSGFTPRDVFGSDAMERLIRDLRMHFDLIVLDCAPILAVAETRIVVRQADTTVLVARAGRTQIGALRSAVAHTEHAGGRVLGVALNYVLPRWQSYADSLYFDESKSYYSIS